MGQRRVLINSLHFCSCLKFPTTHYDLFMYLYVRVHIHVHILIKSVGVRRDGDEIGGKHTENGNHIGNVLVLKLSGGCMVFITAMLHSLNRCYVYHIRDIFFIIQKLGEKGRRKGQSKRVR